MKNLNYITLIGIHVLIGLCIYIFKPLSKIYFLAIFCLCLYKILTAKSKTRNLIVLSSCAYVVGSEVFLRMTGGNILYEASKYFVIVFLLLGIILGNGVNKKSYIYIIYLLILVPGIVVAASTLNYDTNIRKAIAFNLSGPVCLGISALYCYSRKIKMKDLQAVLLALILPVISTTIYLFLYTPSIKSVLSGTGSNFAASGGFSIRIIDCNLKGACFWQSGFRDCSRRMNHFR